MRSSPPAPEGVSQPLSGPKPQVLVHDPTNTELAPIEPATHIAGIPVSRRRDAPTLHPTPQDLPRNTVFPSRQKRPPRKRTQSRGLSRVWLKILVLLPLVLIGSASLSHPVTAPNPSLSMEDTVIPGQAVTVKGFFFTPHLQFVITTDTPHSTNSKSSTVTVSNDGTFQTQVYIDPLLPPRSLHTLYVLGQDDKVLVSIEFIIRA
jgi:hypothetical protein